MTETGKAVQDKEKQVQNSYSKGEGFPVTDKKGIPLPYSQTKKDCAWKIVQISSGILFRAPVHKSGQEKSCKEKQK